MLRWIFALAVFAAVPYIAVADDIEAALSATLLPLLPTEADSFDAERRDIMPMTTDLPWGAVGFLDNGCTATLIDNQHILAASHCFTFDGNGQTAASVPFLQGAWQKGLTFFPNYHPNRPNPPRYAIDRVIVGTRVQTNSDAPADWGIAHLATPVTGFPVLSMKPMERWQYPATVTFAGYARDDTTYPQKNASFAQPAPGGYCANFSGNCWWIPAFIDPNCLAIDEANGFVRSDGFSCLTQGGNSGSPVLWSNDSTFQITGVISGGGGFWSASGFQYAPRYASGVSIVSYEDGSKRTQVFATDSDLARVVSRTHLGASPSKSFNWFQDNGAVPGAGPIASFTLKNGKPQVVVASANGKLYTSYVDTNDQWTAWQNIPTPARVNGFLDIAATTDANGLSYLYLIGSNHELYIARALSIAPGAGWGAWKKQALSVEMKRVSAVLHGDGRQQILLLSTAGAVYNMWQINTTVMSTWSRLVAFGDTTLSPVVDIDAMMMPDGLIQIFVMDASGNGWVRRATQTSPTAAWEVWKNWSVPLYAPIAITPPVLDGIASLTVGQWFENSTTIIPAVFSTDQQGNIYFTKYTSGQWQPWRSFYN